VRRPINRPTVVCADCDDLGLGVAAHVPHAQVVAVQDGQAIRRQRFDDRALLAGDLLLRAEVSQVCLSDCGDDPDARRGDLAQLTDLAKAISTHLQHEEFMVRLQPAQGDRHAQSAVEVGRILKDAPAPAQDGRQGRAGAGLADAAGDGDDGQGAPAHGLARVARERLVRVGHADQQPAR
jgi:hypothetical protein